MAHEMALGNETDLKWIFNVTYPVGPNGVNRWDDVMLVQHALNVVMAPFELKDARGRPITSYLKRDGLFGPRTAEAILAYQTQARQVRKRMITVDGSVDPANHTGWTTHAQVQYTIVYLNRDHRDLRGRMMDEADFPEPLRNLLLKRA